MSNVTMCERCDKNPICDDAIIIPGVGQIALCGSCRNRYLGNELKVKQEWIEKIYEKRDAKNQAIADSYKVKPVIEKDHTQFGPDTRAAREAAIVNLSTDGLPKTEADYHMKEYRKSDLKLSARIRSFIGALNYDALVGAHNKPGSKVLTIDLPCADEYCNLCRPFIGNDIKLPTIDQALEWQDYHKTPNEEVNALRAEVKAYKWPDPSNDNPDGTPKLEPGNVTVSNSKGSGVHLDRDLFGTIIGEPRSYNPSKDNPYIDRGIYAAALGEEIGSKELAEKIVGGIDEDTKILDQEMGKIIQKDVDETKERHSKLPFYANPLMGTWDNTQGEGRPGDPNGPTFSIGYESLHQERLKDTHPDKAAHYSKGKVPLQLVDPILANAVAKVLAFGISKGYEPNNWRKGMEWSEVLGSLERHIAEWKVGIDNDPQSNLNHLAHAACNIMFLLYYQETCPELDDRESSNGAMERIMKEAIDDENSTGEKDGGTKAEVSRDGCEKQA